MDGLDAYTAMKRYPETFGARVYKVSRDRQGTRLTHVKITGGVLKAKQVLDNGEKVDQLRLYSGEQFTMVNEVPAGQVCCLKGPMTVSYTHLDVYKRQVLMLVFREPDELWTPGDLLSIGAAIEHVCLEAVNLGLGAVSYTHLDVYKRQGPWARRKSSPI